MSKNKNAVYQQNIDIIKSFFRKPIVLITGIVTLLSSIVFSVTLFLSTEIYADLISGVFEDILLNVKNYSVAISFDADANSPFSLDLLSVLIGVSFILMFAFGRSKSNSINGGATFYKILAQIEYVLSIIVAVCAVLVLIFVLAGDFKVIMKLVLTVLLIFKGAFVFIFGYSQLRFAKSIKESMESIYLSRSGSMLFAVISFIGAVCMLAVISAFIVMSFLWGGFSSSTIAVSFLVPIVLIFASLLLWGITAVKYSRYIEGISKGSVKMPFETAEDDNEELVCCNCGTPLTEEDVFCHVCGTKQ